MTFADYFGLASSTVSASQFPWLKFFRESLPAVAKIADFRRSDAEQPDPEGRVSQCEKSSVREMKNKFSAIGFGARQLAVMSAFLGPDQSETEALLASDPDVLPWVQKYQRSHETVSQTDYEVDLITTLNKTEFFGPTNQL